MAKATKAASVAKAKKPAKAAPAAKKPAKAETPVKAAAAKKPAPSAKPAAKPATVATTGPQFWLVKSEPEVFAWKRLVKDGTASWDGVRSYESRNNLRAMKVGDLAFFYHSNEGREIVGVAKVTRTAYADPTAPGEDWSAVDIAPVVALTKPVGLARIREMKALESIAMIKKNRLSVTPVTAAEFQAILREAETKLEA